VFFSETQAGCLGYRRFGPKSLGPIEDPVWDSFSSSLKLLDCFFRLIRPNTVTESEDSHGQMMNRKGKRAGALSGEPRLTVFRQTSSPWN
jgi:hypothetical protein